MLILDVGLVIKAIARAASEGIAPTVLWQQYGFEGGGSVEHTGNCSNSRNSSVGFVSAVHTVASLS